MLIVLCTDRNYLMACAACVKSIFENNKSADVEIAILSENLIKKDILGLETISEDYGRKLSIIHIDAKDFASLKASNRFPLSIYYRFIIPSLFKGYHKALYLDCDIIVNGSIEVLDEIDLTDCACACVEDQASDDICRINRIGEIPCYYNSGVILMNLEYWRQHNLSSKCVDFIESFPEKCLYPDQDAINCVLSDQIKALPYRFNMQNDFYANRSDLRMKRSKWSAIDREIGREIIVHYNSLIKPWHLEYNYPIGGLFHHYLAQTPWRNYKCKYYYPRFYTRLLNRIRRIYCLK